LENLTTLAISEENLFTKGGYIVKASTFPPSLKTLYVSAPILAAPDAFAALVSLKRLTLSNTAINWTDFPHLANQSAAQ
jgi:hypothetical protein